MEINAIQEILHAMPFQPFSLHLADGRKFPIPHPDFLATYKRRVVYSNPKNSSWMVIEPLLIVSLDFEG